MCMGVAWGEKYAGSISELSAEIGSENIVWDAGYPDQYRDVNSDYCLCGVDVPASLEKVGVRVAAGVLDYEEIKGEGA